MDLLQPKELELVLPSGGTKVYTLSKFPAVAGREIIAKYPTANLPKMGEYSVSEETMLKLMHFVAVRVGDTMLRLSTKTLVDQHVPDWETLAQLEWAMMEYNCSFFQNGRLSVTLEKFAQKALQSISQMLTASSGQSSQETKQPS